MRPFRSWFSAVAAGLLLAACGTAPTPLASESVGTSTVVALEGAVFLPPIGPPIDRSDFFAGADLSFVVHAVLQNGRDVDKEPLLTLTADVRDSYYQATWRLQETVQESPGTTLVRVFAQASNLGGSALDRACRGQRDCVVGSFDALIQKPRNGRVPAGVIDLTTTQSLPIKVFLQANAGVRPGSLSDLRRLSDGQPFGSGDRSGNCIVNGFTLPGQGVNALGAGVNALGAVGGLFVLDPDGITTGMRLLDPTEAGAWAAGLTPSPGGWSGAILVVDDFGPGGDTFALTDGLFPSFAGTPEADATAFLTALIASGALSHGALVLHHTLRMVEAAGFVEVAAPSADFRVFSHVSGWPYLVVAAVDVGSTDLDTANVGARLQNALDALRYVSDFLDDDFAVLDVAVNMSFVIVPCSVLDDYRYAVAAIEALTTFEDYVAALGADNAVANDFYAELTGLLLAPLDEAHDPLLAQIRLCEGSARAERTPLVPAMYVTGSAKVDSISGPGSYLLAYGDHTVTIDVRDTPAGQVLDWQSTHRVGRVYVKGGQGGSEYVYAGGAFSGSDLHAPTARNGKHHDVSHVVVDFTDARPLAFLQQGSWGSTRSWSDLVRLGGSETPWDCARGRLNHIASAGNFGLAYPLFPAAWDVVVAVSSQDAVEPAGLDTLRSGFSNAGEVMAPGALYELGRTTVGDQVLAYAGTSFSSPVVSLFAALDLMQDAPACGEPTFSRLTLEPDAGDTELPTAVAACASSAGP